MDDSLQQKIQAQLDQWVADGRENGVQIAVYLDGKLAVDAFAGVADTRTGRKVDGDTIFPVFSTTKGIFSTVIHILAARGLIDYDEPIATYWPEFAANGKEAITMRHAMSHTAGIPFMPDGVTKEEILDWDCMCAKVAQLRPATKPGAVQQYHPITFGWILGEVARRVDGRSVPQLVAEELCRPLGMTNLYCGIPAEIEPTTAYLEFIPPPAPVATPPPTTISPVTDPLHEWMNRPEARMSPQPGAHGIASARSVARLYAALLPGGVDGVELLSPERVRLATEVQEPTDGRGADFDHKALGYQVGTKSDYMGHSPTAFGHGGHGGSQGYADTRYRFAVGMTRNLFSPTEISIPIIGIIRDHLGAPVARAS